MFWPNILSSYENSTQGHLNIVAEREGSTICAKISCRNCRAMARNFKYFPGRQQMVSASGRKVTYVEKNGRVKNMKNKKKIAFKIP